MDIISYKSTYIIAGIFFILYIFLLFRQHKADMTFYQKRFPRVMSMPTPRWYKLFAIIFTLLIPISFFVFLWQDFLGVHISLKRLSSFMVSLVFLLAFVPFLLIRKYERDNNIDPKNSLSSHLEPELRKTTNFYFISYLIRIIILLAVLVYLYINFFNFYN